MCPSCQWRSVVDGERETVRQLCAGGVCIHVLMTAERLYSCFYSIENYNQKPVEYHCQLKRLSRNTQTRLEPLVDLSQLLCYTMLIVYLFGVMGRKINQRQRYPGIALKS